MTKPFLAYDSQRYRSLGLLNGSPIFTVETLAEGEMHDLREVGFQLTDSERDIAATAAALTHWHRLEPHCPRCGGADHRDQRRAHSTLCSMRPRPFPATDPAVIVAVIDAEDRLLLGGQPTWGNRVSVLAGFVESGESLSRRSTARSARRSTSACPSCTTSAASHGRSRVH